MMAEQDDMSKAAFTYTLAMRLAAKKRTYTAQNGTSQTAASMRSAMLATCTMRRLASRRE
jgi:hypothetical protein